jgi:hypothetical protein
MKSNLPEPSRIERARSRLDAAVARLEAALENRPAGGDNPAAELASGLQAELQSLRRETVRLKAVNETVSGRLDGAIGRLKTVIGNA